MSNNDHEKICERDVRTENFAAELTDAIYPLLLRRGSKHSWIKMELVVWRRLTRTIKRWIRERPPATPPRELDVLRARLLVGDPDDLALSLRKD
jgi:hypothetical protein